VGKRNHKYFFLFTLTTFIHAVLTIALDAVYLMFKEDYSDDDDDALPDPAHIVSMGCLIFCAMITLCVGGLVFYHGRLACLGLTTNEEIRANYGQNPYDLGCSGNCRAFWYGGTSRVHSKVDYSEEDLCKLEPNVFVLRPA